MASLYNETRHKLQAVSHSALDPFRMAAYGDSGVNRSIGRQNGYRQDTIYDKGDSPRCGKRREATKKAPL